MSIEDARERLEEAESAPFSDKARQQARLSQAHALIAIHDMLLPPTLIPASQDDVEPLLASDASRQAMRRLTRGEVPAHEVLADAIWQAEERGFLAATRVILSLGDATVDDLHRVDKQALRRLIDKELGRG